MNFIMKEILVQSDLVLVLLNLDYFQLNIYIKHSQTFVYRSKYYKFNVNIYYSKYSNKTIPETFL